MKSKKFPQSIFNKIKQSLERTLQNNIKPIAAFDADGTLWDADLGESFFKYQIENCNLASLTNLLADPWKHYRDWKDSGDPRPAYLWLAQINQGQKIETVRGWAKECVIKNSPLPIFEEQRSLIEFFQQNNVEIYIVTASVKWAVEPGAEILGVPAENVLGVETEVSGGLITDKQRGEITYREGKAEAVLQRTGGVRPFFCCGNTMGDFSLLELSTGAALAFGSASRGDELFKTENDLRLRAVDLGWLSYTLEK